MQVTMRLLVLTTEPVTADQLRRALPEGTEPDDAEVMVVAPALQEDALHFWMSDADDAIANAKEIWRETVERLDERGVAASGDTGESDPEQAIQDALQSFTADRIVLFTHPESRRRYKEDLDPAELRERFGIPVDHALVS
jgi:nucleotide-binding universal stress UspA family protein